MVSMFWWDPAPQTEVTLIFGTSESSTRPQRRREDDRTSGPEDDTHTFFKSGTLRGPFGSQNRNMG